MTCNKCGVAKEQAAFYTRKNGRVDKICNACLAAAAKSRRCKRKENGQCTLCGVYSSTRLCASCRKKVLTLNVGRHHECKRMAVALLGGACADCGIRSEHYEIYDFHHKDPSSKDANIAHLFVSVAWEKAKVELEKCVLLCSNCHRIRHVDERNGR